MLAQQTNVEVISNNIANMTTTGYKRQRPEFQDLIYQSLRRVGADSSDSGSIVPSGAQVGLGVEPPQSIASTNRVTCNRHLTSWMLTPGGLEDQGLKRNILSSNC